jgi:undecaprenyl-diphosphatase
MTTGSYEARSRPWWSGFARRHPRASVALLVASGFAAAALLLWGFFAIVDEIPERGSMVRLDVAVARWLETHGTEWGESIFSRVSWLGAPALTVIIVAAVVAFAWRREWLPAGALALASIGGSVLDNVLKPLFHRGRPETAWEFVSHPSWSFPSGHAMNSIVGFGFLAMLLLERQPRRPIRIAILTAAVLLIAVIGFSRLYLGVHYLSDVVGGYLAGAVWLLVCIAGYRVDRARLRGAGTGKRG